MMQQQQTDRSTQQVAGKSQRGFTLIEITLSMVFVAFIITILAATTVNIIRSYNKGIWLSQINQAGQQLNEDIGNKARYSTIAKVDKSRQRLCVGGISYLWNTEEQLRNGAAQNKFVDKPNQPFSLVRIEDDAAAYCGDDSPSPNSKDSKVKVLLGRGAAIQWFEVTQGVKDEGSDTQTAEQKSIPLLSVSTVISTEGSDRPALGYTDPKNGEFEPDPYWIRSDSNWMCGQWVDGEFKPGRNQYCSFAEYNIIVYERSLDK